MTIFDPAWTYVGPAGEPAAIDVAGSRVDLMTRDNALEAIADAAGDRSGRAALAVASANLDHLHHFGPRGAARGTAMVETDQVRWLNLIDGAPIAAKARQVTGMSWPRLAGSDLLWPILETAAARGHRVGFLGGSEEMLTRLSARLGAELPELVVAGLWSPSRAEITDPVRSAELAEKVAASDTAILVVGLGKPRQEAWIQRHGAATGAGVLLAFGASADFIAGSVTRAPRWVQDAGLEWGYRLAKEPRRMWRRYLVQGPPAYVQLRTATLIINGLASS